MILRFHLMVWLTLPLVCCDKPANPKQPPGDSLHPAKDERPARPRREKSEPQENLRTALQSAREIQSPEAREKAVAEVAWNAIDLDPALAREAFGQLTTDSPEKIRLIQHFAMRLAEQNSGEALAWAKSLESEKEIAAAHGHIALVIADTDPARAANLLSESGIAGREFDVAVVQVLQRWAAKSAPEAAAWVLLFPPGKSREAGLKTVVSQWAEHDAQAVFSWMAALQEPKLRDETARAMAETLIEQTPEVRNQWLQHADPQTRSRIDNQQKEAGLDDTPPSNK